jgi:hypothetical protein
VQPIIGFLQPAQLSGAQLPNVEAPVPTSRGGGGGGRGKIEPLPVHLRATWGFERYVVDASTSQALKKSFADLRNVAGLTYLPPGDTNWKPILRLLGGKEDAEITFSGIRFTPASMEYEKFVDNLRHILGSQPPGAYTEAVKGDIAQYLREIIGATRNSNEKAANDLDKVRELLELYPGQVGAMLKIAARDPRTLFVNFLKQLRSWLSHSPNVKNAREVLQALQSSQVRDALHAAITAGIARYIALRLGAISVGRNTITDPQLVSGIAGILLGYLSQIAWKE